VDYGAKTIVARIGEGVADAGSLAGRVARIFNGKHSCIYRIASAEAKGDSLTLRLTGSDVFTGRIRIESVAPDGSAVTTRTNLLQQLDLAGMHLVTDDLRYGVPIASREEGTLRFEAGSRLAPFVALPGTQEKSDAWIADFGVGDRVEIERFLDRPLP